MYTYVVPYGFYGAPISNRLPNKAANSACNYYVDLRNQISYPNTLGNVVVTSVNADYTSAGSLTIVSLGSSGSVAGFNISNGTEAVNYYIKTSCPVVTPSNTVVETYNVEFTLPVGIRSSAYDKLILEGDVIGIGLGVITTTLSPSVLANVVTNNTIVITNAVIATNTIVVGNTITVPNTCTTVVFDLAYSDAQNITTLCIKRPAITTGSREICFAASGQLGGVVGFQNYLGEPVLWNGTTANTVSNLNAGQGFYFKLLYVQAIDSLIWLETTTGN